MRRLLLTLLCGLVAAPAALAGARATGDGVFELNDVYGKVVVGTIAQPARGVLWGQMESGTLRTVDPQVGDGAILVSGYDNKRVYPATDSTPKITVYTGHIHFRVTGGKYSLTFINAFDVNLTAVGVGAAWLTGDAKADDPGTYAVDSGDWQPVPTDSVDTPLKVSFPAPSVTPSP